MQKSGKIDTNLKKKSRSREGESSLKFKGKKIKQYLLALEKSGELRVTSPLCMGGTEPAQ
jgi:hypothetical protein